MAVPDSVRAGLRRRPKAVLFALAVAAVAVVVAAVALAGSGGTGRRPAAAGRDGSASPTGVTTPPVIEIPTLPARSVPASPTPPSGGAATGGAAPRPGTPRAAAAAQGAGNAAATVPFRSVTPTASDEFSGSGLNLSQWDEYDGTATNGSVWSASADRVTGGELQIVGTGTNPSGAGNVSGGACWGCLTGGHRYGVWQLRARFDAGAGYAPAIGLWPAQGDVTSTGWLALAYVAQPNRTSSEHVVHGPDGSSLDGSVGGSLTGWHTYTLEWRPTYVKMYLDSTLMVDTTAGGVKVTIPSASMYLYIQQDVGPTDQVPAPNGSTPAQVTTHVDWVKYFS
jgi:hypothetical protein